MRLDYDAYNDVLRVWTEPQTPETVAVPGDDITVLVSETHDRVVGLVFERFRPVVMKGVPEGTEYEELRREVFRLSFNLVENLVPKLISGCAPVAKDRIAQWLEYADSHGL